MSEHVSYDVHEGLAVIRLKRPEALNALTYQMIEAVRTHTREAEADETVTAIAITGEGRAFCAGIDLSLLEKDAGRGEVNRGGAKPDPNESPALFSNLLRVSKPVFGAVNGVSAGGGFVLAMMCDMRFVSEDASFTTVFSKRGLIAEHGMSWLVPRQIGISRALDLLWSSRKVGAEEAMRLGLADRVVPADQLIEAVAAYTQELRENVSPRALAVIKEQVYAHLSQPYLPAAQECDRLMVEALRHPDALEGAKSFMERRPPRFAPWRGRDK